MGVELGGSTGSTGGERFFRQLPQIWTFWKPVEPPGLTCLSGSLLSVEFDLRPVHVLMGDHKMIDQR